MWQRVGDLWYAVVVLLAGPASLLVEKTPQLSRMHSATCNPSTPSGPWLWGEKNERRHQRTSFRISNTGSEEPTVRTIEASDTNEKKNGQQT